MFEIKGKFLTSRYYARQVPLVSRYVYEMSFVERSSSFYKTIPFPTRLIALNDDFSQKYSPRLQKYLRNAESLGLEISRPQQIPDIQTLYHPVQTAKNLGPLPQGIHSPLENYFYSEIYHPKLGRLAAHISIGDRQEGIVHGLVNISRFRSFPNKAQQRICSLANKYLFHRDMMFFRENGFRIYDMVGVREPMNQMKKEFGGEIVQTWTHIPLPVYYMQKIINRIR